MPAFYHIRLYCTEACDELADPYPRHNTKETVRAATCIDAKAVANPFNVV